MAEVRVVEKSFIDLFVDGARKGLNIAVMNMMPNVIFAFIIIKALQASGLLKLIGDVCAPVMALWGLPGEAATVLVAAFMSMGGGVGVAASLYNAGSINGMDASLLLPAIYIMGNPMQNVGRCLGTAGVDTKYFGVVTVICVSCSLLSMWFMRFLLLFF